MFCSVFFFLKLKKKKILKLDIEFNGFKLKSYLFYYLLVNA